MSRTAVRNAISQYLNQSEVTLLGRVFAHAPRITTEDAFVENGYPGQGSGAVIWLHIARQHERRIALGGPTSGVKWQIYQVTLICLLRSKKRTAESAGEDNDTFLDSLVTAIRADRNAGDPGAIFQWGEGDGLYGVDVEIESRLPRPTRQQEFHVFSLCRVQAAEVPST